MPTESDESAQNEDLDAFLIGVESKLRTPFSSLDFAKAVTTTALRSSSPREYLELISKVMPRMDKVIQNRVMVGMLALESSRDINDIVYDNLCQVEDESHEEWARVIAGLVRGIMFRDESAEPCRGKEAKDLVEKSCKDILQLVEAQNQEEITDTDPLFAPYRYSLLNPQLLDVVLPECRSNPHCQIDEEADILLIDSRNENAKAKEEEKERAQNKSRAPIAPNKSLVSTTLKAGDPGPNITMKGLATSSSATASKKVISKSSMFMPKKTAVAGQGGRLGRQLQNMRKPAASLQARKKGSAQALLAKGRSPGAAMGTAAAAAATATGSAVGRQMKYGHNKSKMKMIDVTEVEGLSREQKSRQDKTKKTETKEQKRNRIIEAAAAKGLVSKSSKRIKTGETLPAAAIATPKAIAVVADGAPAGALGGHGAGLAAAALLAYQAQTNAPMESEQSVVESAAGAPEVEPILPVAQVTGNEVDHSSMLQPQQQLQAPPPTKQATGDWRHLLEKSNKLSGEDRFRVKQFFEDRFNPTPGMAVYKMKLHEEKTVDNETGQVVKETLYLELDYNTFGFKKLRKIKKK